MTDTERPWVVYRDTLNIYGTPQQQRWSDHAARAFAEEWVRECEERDRTVRGLIPGRDVRYRITRTP